MPKITVGEAMPFEPRAKELGRMDDATPAISLWQPFASLIFTWDRHRGEFVKANETRSFRLPPRLIGQRVAIHATAKFPALRLISPALHELCYDHFGCSYNYSLPLGALLGFVRFGAPVPTGEAAPFQHEDEIAAGDWTPGRWAWPILEASALETPLPMKGRQGWWTVPADAQPPQTSGQSHDHSPSSGTSRPPVRAASQPC